MDYDKMESHYTEVYGKTFSAYNHDDIGEFVAPLEDRFDSNGIDPGDVFGGKQCLDAGCGSGRGGIFMLRHGASKVTLFDISSENVETAAANCESFGYRSVDGERGNLLDLPFADEAFDVVWCNGVIHHTADPDGALTEIARVLKKGGRLWLYVYGAGGVEWYTVRRLRQMLKGFGAGACHAMLSLLGLSTTEIATLMDDWMVQYLCSYTQDELGTRLSELGFEDVTVLPFGAVHDRSHHRTVFPRDSVWIGEGDLRYLLTKSGRTVPFGAPSVLPGGEYGSGIPFSDQIVEQLGGPFDRLSEAVCSSSTLGVAAAARVHLCLLEQLDTPLPFDIRRFVGEIDELTDLAQRARG